MPEAVHEHVRRLVGLHETWMDDALQSYLESGGKGAARAVADWLETRSGATRDLAPGLRWLVERGRRPKVTGEGDQATYTWEAGDSGPSHLLPAGVLSRIQGSPTGGVESLLAAAAAVADWLRNPAPSPTPTPTPTPQHGGEPVSSQESPVVAATPMPPARERKGRTPT